jgi:hypothetical protein
MFKNSSSVQGYILPGMMNMGYLVHKLPRNSDAQKTGRSYRGLHLARDEEHMLAGTQIKTTRKILLSKRLGDQTVYNSVGSTGTPLLFRSWSNPVMK